MELSTGCPNINQTMLFKLTSSILDVARGVSEPQNGNLKASLISLIFTAINLSLNDTQQKWRNMYLSSM